MSLPSNGEWHPLWVSNIRYVFQTRNRNFLKEVSEAIKLGDHDTAFLSSLSHMLPSKDAHVCKTY